MSKIIDLVVTDGGRAASGRDRSGKVGDCVTRAASLLIAHRQGLPVHSFATGDDEVSGDDFGLVYDHVWRVLNAHQSEWIAEQVTAGHRNGRRGWASSVDKGTYPKVWRPVFENIFGFRKRKLGQIKPTLTEAFEAFGACVVSKAKHVFTILPQPDGVGAVYDLGDVRTYNWEACLFHNPTGRGPASACHDHGDYSNCDMHIVELERKAISLWTP